MSDTQTPRRVEVVIQLNFSKAGEHLFSSGTFSSVRALGAALHSKVCLPVSPFLLTSLCVILILQFPKKKKKRKQSKTKQNKACCHGSQTPIEFCRKLTSDFFFLNLEMNFPTRVSKFL